MSDLVERLRTANTWLNEGDCCGQLDASGTCMAPACIFGEALKMAHEAADRIEQLEAALRMQLYSQNLFDALTIARAALGEKP